MFLVRSKLSITVYLSLVLYRSTSLQSLLFLKNIKTFLCKQKLVNNCSIPLTQQPYNHDSFSKISADYSLTVTIVSQKISRTFYASRNQRIIVVFLQCMLKDKLPIFLINTLILYIPLLALTDGRNHRWRHEDTCCAWAGVTFFPVVLLCQFLVSGGKQFQVLLTYHTSCAIVSFFSCGGKEF